MQRDVAVRCVGLRFSVLTLGPALRYSDSSLAPQHVRPAQRQNLRRAQGRRRTSKHQCVVKRRGEALEYRERLSRADDDRPVAGLGTRLDVLRRILRDVLVQDADLVNAVHEAPYLRYRRPGKSVRFVKGRGAEVEQWSRRRPH
jgi:hypothetical protein